MISTRFTKMLGIRHPVVQAGMGGAGGARHAEAAGVHIIVAQGMEAGGHVRGQVGLLPLLPAVVEAVTPVPVIAAGGIVDGRGLAAPLALGADGVWVGTRFVASPEAHGVEGYKDTLLGTAEDGTVVTRAYTGKTCRVVANTYTRWWEDHPDELQAFPAQFV